MTVAARLAEHAALLSALDPQDVPIGICLCASSQRTIACSGRHIEPSILLGWKAAEVREAGQMTWERKEMREADSVLGTANNNISKYVDSEGSNRFLVSDS
jgi:alkanesulfonate monooxygenase SsuD/methylene tetrahydromethanopterin reductase-like flavin-dependent oxidoreductase (luciferase family)